MTYGKACMVLKYSDQTSNPLYPNKYCTKCLTMNEKYENEKCSRYFGIVDDLNANRTRSTSFSSDCTCAHFETQNTCDEKIHDEVNWGTIARWTSCEQEKGVVNMDCLKTQLEMFETSNRGRKSSGFGNLWRDLGGVSPSSNMKPLFRSDAPLLIENARDFFKSFEVGESQQRIKERVCFELSVL